MAAPPLSRRTLVTGALLALLVAAWLLLQERETHVSNGEQALLEAFENQRSGVVAEFSATVVRMLADDNEGSRHQRFLVKLQSGQTLLISHNIDLAERVPVEVGDHLSIRGQYEWNDRGGVIHWTHHDPDGRREGGWIEASGRRYR